MTHFCHCKEPLGPETLEEWADSGWMLVNHWTTWDRRFNRHCYIFAKVRRN